MAEGEMYMQRCLQLARNGAGRASPNPMVGAVLVHGTEVVSEAFHRAPGNSHAEALALDQVKDPSILPDCTLYVNLEPCCHHGRTPPCTERILNAGVGKLVFGSYDPNPEVAGKGVEELRKGGCKVEGPLLEAECKALNRRFFTYHREKRPYLILKWARTLDGFIDKERENGTEGIEWITGRRAQRAVHLWRSEEDAILVGKNTVQNDDPSLTTRLVEGKDPLRVLIDPEGELSQDRKFFHDGVPTLIFTQNAEEDHPSHIEKIPYGPQESLIPRILSELYERRCLSLIVEGGAKTLEGFIQAGYWDEARILVGDRRFGTGKAAPELQGKEVQRRWLGDDRLIVLKRERA